MGTKQELVDRLTETNNKQTEIVEQQRQFSERLDFATADLVRIDNELEALREKRQDALAAGTDTKSVDREMTLFEKERHNQSDLIAGCNRAIAKALVYRDTLEGEAAELQKQIDDFDFDEMLAEYNAKTQALAALLKKMSPCAPEWFKDAAHNRLTIIDLETDQIVEVWTK
jgi:chromosome segregation ATPase